MTVVERFKANGAAESATGASDGAGREFTTHDRELKATIVINLNNWVAILQSLRDDAVANLTAQECRIVKESGDAASGFQIQYMSGRSRGTVTIEPLKSVDPGIFAALPAPGKIIVQCRIHVIERWFATEKAFQKAAL
jgi:hypothetical protein